MGTETVLRSVRWLRNSLIVVGAAALLAWMILFSIDLYAHSQAQSLVSAVRSMSDATTLEEFRPTLARYRASTLPASWSAQYSADTGFDINVSNQTIAKLGLRFYFLRYIGLAPWGAGVEIYFRNGRLCQLRYTVATETSAKNQFREGFAISTEESFPGKGEYFVSGSHMTWNGPYFCRVHRIKLPADATPGERAHAFAYNLSCVTSLDGCQDVNQVLPLRLIRQDIDARHSD